MENSKKGNISLKESMFSDSNFNLLIEHKCCHKYLKIFLRKVKTCLLGLINIYFLPLSKNIHQTRIKSFNVLQPYSKKTITQKIVLDCGGGHFANTTAIWWLDFQCTILYFRRVIKTMQNGSHNSKSPFFDLWSFWSKGEIYSIEIFVLNFPFYPALRCLIFHIMYVIL